MRTMKLLALGAALAITGVACSSTDDGGAISPPETSAPSDPSMGDGADATVAGTITNTFEPATVTVSVGDTVEWTWEGFHNVVADDGTFNSGEATDGGTFSHTFTEAGEFPYYCSVHGSAGGNGMAATVVVEA